MLVPLNEGRISPSYEHENQLPTITSLFSWIELQNEYSVGGYRLGADFYAEVFRQANGSKVDITSIARPSAQLTGVPGATIVAIRHDRRDDQTRDICFYCLVPIVLEEIAAGFTSTADVSNRDAVSRPISAPNRRIQPF